MTKTISVLLCIILAGVTLSYAQVTTPTSNINYCAQPVFSSNAVKPNIMIVQDQSGSMQFPAYIGGNLDSYGGNRQGDWCARSTTADDYARDKYRVTQRYYGYFENESYYQYSSGNNRFEINTACINTDKIGTPGCISGNLLNWITTTRTDVVRKALTGGRRYASDTTNVTLQSEGARFEDTSAAYACNTLANAYVSGNRYRVGDTVSYSGANYRCIVEHRTPARNPLNTTYWTPAVYDYVGYFTDNTLNCTFRITATNTYTRQLAISGGSCPLGTLTSANVRVKKDKPVIAGVVQDYWGIVQDFYQKASFEFMIYKSDTATNYGTILNGKTDSASLVQKDALYTNINTTLPYWGTPTGQAMKSAREYFRQVDQGLSYSNNSAYIGLYNGTKDPWYDQISGVNKAVPCRQSYILLLSDGNWNVGSAPGDDPAQVAYNLHTTDQRTTALSNGTDLSDSRWRQTVSTYAIYAFGDKDTETAAQGRQSMITTAIMGGFAYAPTETTPLPYGFSVVPSDSRLVEYPNTSCDPLGTWAAQCNEWDKARTGYPYNYFEFTEDEDGEALVERITDAMFDMVRRSSSGTAASVLASSEGSGANLLQAVYYPRRMFTNAEIEWTGALQNLWYFIDPQLGGSTIREDDGDHILSLASDNIINFFFKQTENKTKALRGTGASATEIELDDVNNLWEAGGMLWKMDPSERKIYTWINSMTTRADFNVANAPLLMNYLQATSQTEAEDIIEFTYGYAPPTVPNTYRNRLVQTEYKGTTGTHVWKLGDIISSTPRSKSSVPLNTYHLPTPDGYNDMTYWLYVNDLNSDGTVNSAGRYKAKGMAYTGANDGMFHAFNLGKLSFTGLASGQIAKLESGDGKEEWAFIPQNALPYLRYMTAANYCHVFTVDNPPQIFDVSAPGATQSLSAATRTKDSWRTIVIGSMGAGGACRPQNGSCNSGSDCVKTPVDIVGFREIGRSSYFALDVTDPTSAPQLLWEFASNTLGFSTSGVAIVRINDPADNMSTNGKWFAVIASGPTGPIETTENQFLGRSDQPLTIFILDLITGAVVREINTGINYAFGGSLNNATIDVERGARPSAAGRYSDDVLYLGYTEKDGTEWKKGGVLRLLTRNNPDPATWTWSKVIDNIGPVTSAVSHLQDRQNHKLWLYFGTGRYFYRLNGGMTLDDADNQRTIYGVKEPCYSSSNVIDTGSCRMVSGLTNKTTDATATAASTDGWYINLGASSGNFKYERVITDPLATFNGVVYFTTFAPSTEVCEIGGRTYIWAADYQSGGRASQLAMIGKAVIQVSSGAIEMIDLATGFTDNGGRKTGNPIMGIPPKGQGLSLLMAPRPMKKILQIKEK